MRRFAKIDRFVAIAFPVFCFACVVILMEASRIPCRAETLIVQGHQSSALEKLIPMRDFDLDPRQAFSPVVEYNWSEKDMSKRTTLLSNNIGGGENVTVVYFITPTYYNPGQWVNIIRLGQTLMNDPLIYWIVVEDAVNCTLRIRKWLESSGMMYAHLAATSPPKAQSKKGGPRGVNQRNRALDLVETLPDGVVYFGDDDNAYDLRLFPELRKTKRVSVFNIAFVAAGMYERCAVNKTTGEVAKIISNWQGGRKFPMDMGGWGFHSHVIKMRKPRFRNEVTPGFLEEDFMKQVANSTSELQPLNSNCTRVYTWHVKTGGVTTAKVTSDPDFEKLKGLI
jgi:beta-1,3-glucuronyltransferase